MADENEMMLSSIHSVTLLVSAFIFSFYGTKYYVAYAQTINSVVSPNSRSLHDVPTPSGAGIVFSFVFIVLVAALWIVAAIDTDLASLLVLGGGIATIVGYIDDRQNISQSTKLLIQGCLAAWILYCFDGKPLIDLPTTPRALDLAVSWIALVWLMNLYNFIDGIDGMAASGALFICATAVIALLIALIADPVTIVFGVLAACILGFLIFNWPPAKVFMGDAGSLFLGFVFCTLIARTIGNNQISLWTWLTIFGYFAADTTTTTLLRFVLVKKWYQGHRSHAYQNLARIWGSHRKVLWQVIAYHAIWLLPLAIWSVYDPARAPLSTLLAFAPSVLWALRFGPLLSRS